MTAIVTIDTARLTLRAPGPTDVAAVQAFYASDRARFVGGCKDAEGAWRQLATEIGHWALRGYGRWIVEEKATATACGIVGLWNPEGWPEPELGWDLFEGFDGRGYATEAAEAARAYAYDRLGWRTVISLIDPDNTASARVADRLCARPDGSFAHPHFGTAVVYRHPVPEVCS